MGIGVLAISAGLSLSALVAPVRIRAWPALTSISGSAKNR